MTTTEPTTGADVYTLLEELRGARITDDTRRAIDDVRDLMAVVRPVADRARALITDHEANGQIVRAHVIGALGGLIEPGEVEEGLWFLMDELSGARELRDIMRDLAELCDPETVKQADVAQARDRLEGATAGANQ